jgi:hypothetical protein
VLAKTWIAGGRLIAGCVSWQHLFSGSPTPQPIRDSNRFVGFPELHRDMRDVGEGGVFPDLAHPVATLQNAINIATRREGANRLLEPDGDFGGKTETAVRDFQAFCRAKNPSLEVNGVAGARTWALLDFFLDLAGR